MTRLSASPGAIRGWFALDGAMYLVIWTGAAPSGL